MINAKQKGARGERLWRDELNAAGFSGSYRHAQQGYGGGVDNADVMCPMLSEYHWECKFTQKLQIYKAMEQAVKDSAGKRIPVVASKRKNEEWLVTMKAKDFLELLKKNIPVEYSTDNNNNEIR
jgi:hypothetical protein